jgi:hypothetical protein
MVLPKETMGWQVWEELFSAPTEKLNSILHGTLAKSLITKQRLTPCFKEFK